MGRKEKERNDWKNKERIESNKRARKTILLPKRSTEEVAPVTTTTAAPEPPAEEEMCIIVIGVPPSAETIYKCSADCQRWLGHKSAGSLVSEVEWLSSCKGTQRSKATTRSSSSWKRTRYHYEDDNVDINELQQQADAAANVSTTAFFELFRSNPFLFILPFLFIVVVSMNPFFCSSVLSVLPFPLYRDSFFMSL